MLIFNRAGYLPASTQSDTKSRGAPIVAGLEQQPSNVGQVRSAAVSALNNPRFGMVLDLLTDPRSSSAMTFMRGEGEGDSYETVKARYLENS